MKQMLPFLIALLFGSFLTTNAQPVPNMPATGATNQPIDVTLGWRPLSAVVSYEIEYGTDPKFEDTEWLTTEKSQAEASNLEYLTLYHWRVRGLDQSGESGYGNGRLFQTFTTKPFTRNSCPP